MTLEGRRRRRWATAVSAAAIGAVIATTAGAPALAAADDRAESEGRLLTGGGIVNLNTVAELNGAYSADPTVPGEVANPLSLDVLQGLNLDLGDGIQLLQQPDGSGILAVGAAGQYSNTPEGGIPFASAGAINADGSIAVAPDDPAQNAYVDLTQLLGQADLDGVISQLRLELGAVSASATLDEETGEPVGDYQLADGNLVLTSPAVAGLSGSLSTALDQVESPINNLAGEGGVIDTALNPTFDTIRSTLNGVLLGLGSVDELGVTATADVDLDAAVASVLEAPLTDDDNIVEIDLSTGEVEIDLARAITNSNGGDYDGSLNNLPPNTELLSADLLDTVVDGAVTSALEDLPALLVTAVTDALNTTEINIAIDATVRLLGLPVGDIHITIDGPLGGFLGLNGYDTPETDATSTVLGIPLGNLLSSVTGLVTDTILPALVTPLQNAVTNQEALTGIITPVVGTVTTALDPVLGLISDNVLSATANVQEQDGDFVDERGEDADSFTQRAIKLSILPGGDSSLVDVSLASATVRGELAQDDDNANASSSAAASADADDDSNASAQAAAQAAANADATSEASAASDASAEAAAAAAANADVDAAASQDASADVDVEGNANAAAAAAAQSTADADSTANASASADQSADDNADATSSAAAAAQAAAEADSSTDASQEASADADAAADPEADAEQDADPDGNEDANQDADPEADQDADQNADVNANAAAAAAASANADDDSNAAAEAAAQAAATADADTTASAAADANAEAAAQAAAEADASNDASTDATTEANAAAAAAAQAAADADAEDSTNADASAAADAAADDDANAAAAAAAEAASTADSSNEASADATAEANADAAADPEADAEQDADPDGNEDANQDADPDADQDADSDDTADASSDADGSQELKATVKYQTIIRGTGVVQEIYGTGFEAGEKVSATVHSDPFDLTPVSADDNGRAVFTVAIDDAFALGDHTVALTGESSGAVPEENSDTAFTVTAQNAGSASANGSDSGSSADAAGPGGSGDGLADTGSPMGLALPLGAVLLCLFGGAILIAGRMSRQEA